MITDTLLVVGPGGVGKSPLDKGLRNGMARIDPYRLRSAGPRDRKDVFYAHPKLRDELYLTYQRLGLAPTYLSEGVHWFPQANTLSFRVRDEWQLLILEALPPGIAKAEIFAPVVPVILEHPQIRHLLGRVWMVILNPAGPIEKLADLNPITKATEFNCRRRGDDPDSVARRVNSVDEEVGAWRRMIALGAIEYPNWAFPEWVYGSNESETLVRARAAVLARAPDLEIFFKTEDEIR